MFLGCEMLQRIFLEDERSRDALLNHLVDDAPDEVILVGTDGTLHNGGVEVESRVSTPLDCLSHGAAANAWGAGTLTGPKLGVRRHGPVCELQARLLARAVHNILN